MTFPTAPLLALALAASAPSAPPPAAATPEAAAACTLADADRAWIASAAGAWEGVRRDALQLPAAPLPRLVLFDLDCTWENAPRGDGATTVAIGDGLVLAGTPHGETVALPDGDAVPVRPLTFASTWKDGSGREAPYFVFALGPVWRADERHRQDPHLDDLMRSVFVHEITHTVQSAAFGARLDAIEAARHIDDLDDDIVERRFGDRPEFRASVEAERDLLFAAARETDPSRRALAAEALRKIEARRAHFYTGESAFWGELEDVFLAMEGTAQWAAYRAARTAGADHAAAVERVTGSRRPWSQDEGLALFLAIDALAPGWQAEELGPNPPPVVDILRRALSR